MPQEANQPARDPQREGSPDQKAFIAAESPTFTEDLRFVFAEASAEELLEVVHETSKDGLALHGAVSEEDILTVIRELNESSEDAHSFVGALAQTRKAHPEAAGQVLTAGFVILDMFDQIQDSLSTIHLNMDDIRASMRSISASLDRMHQSLDDFLKDS